MNLVVNYRCKSLFLSLLNKKKRIWQSFKLCYSLLETYFLDYSVSCSDQPSIIKNRNKSSLFCNGSQMNKVKDIRNPYRFRKWLRTFKFLQPFWVYWDLAKLYMYLFSTGEVGNRPKESLLPQIFPWISCKNFGVKIGIM